MKERLQKVIAGAGVCSRREAERLIAGGEVSVNGRAVRRPGLQVDPEVDHVQVLGRRIRPGAPRLTIVLHKPRGCVTTARDPEGRPTVMDLVAGVRQRVFPVGRLDYNAEGLILMTNDGDLAFALMRPGTIAKTYRVKVKGSPSPEKLDQLRRGMSMDGRPLLPVQVRQETHGETSWLQVTLHEGRKNQLVRMMDAIGHPVRRLRRTRVGPIVLGTLPVGHWRPLEPEELLALRQETGLHAPATRRVSRGSAPAPRRAPRRPAGSGGRAARPARTR